MASSADNLKPAVAVRPTPAAAGLVPAGVPRKSDPPRRPPRRPRGVRRTRAAESSLASGPALASSPPAQRKGGNAPAQEVGNARIFYFSAASARLLCERTFRKTKPSKRMMLLLRLPSLRGIKMNVNHRDEPRILHLNRPESIETVLMQLTGHEATEPCEQCQRGLGPFGECIVSEMAYNGACAGCCANRRATKCSLRKVREALEADMDDGQETKEDGEKDLATEGDESEYMEDDDENDGEEHWQNSSSYSSAAPSSGYSSPIEYDA